DGLAVGGGGQPGAGVGGYAVGRPPLNSGRERLGRRLLGDVEVTETPGQGGDHPGPLLVVRLGDPLPDVGHAHRNGRTSIFRLQAFDPSAASLSATSRSGASMIQKPARYSFDSRKGPSVNIASSPRLSMTVAELGAARPPAKTQCPSAWSRSLNTSMAACSSGVARPAVSSITETRYCISDHLLWYGVPIVGGLSPLLRTHLPDPTPPPGRLSRFSGTPVVNDPTRRSHGWAPAPAEARPAAFAALRRTQAFRLQASSPSVASLSVTCFSRLHTVGVRPAGRPGSLCPSGRLAIRPGQALCPGRCRGTAACPGRRPPGRRADSSRRRDRS